MAGAEARRRLIAERERLVGQVDDLSRTFDQVVESSELDMTADDEHDPDGSTIAYERQQVVALLQSARAQLAGVDDALGRLDAGTYGSCDSCGCAIGEERLEALPDARACITCASGRRGHMPMNRDKGRSEKDGGEPSQQKATGGPSSTSGADPEVAAEARGGKVDDGAESIGEPGS